MYSATAAQELDTNADDTGVIRFHLTLRSPVSVEHLPLLARVLRLGFKWRRGLSKRLIGRPSKELFRLMVKAGFPGIGRLRIETQNGPRSVSFNARNTQFSALFFPQYVPFYEAELCTIFDRLVGPNDVFFDIGANWGWHSVVIGTRPSYQGMVHAFEPFPPSYADLAGLVKDAGLENRITCHNLALGEKEGEANMALPDGMHSGGAQLVDDGVKVRIARLDSLNLPLPKLMKIDVEDHEMGVLVGATELIKKARPFIVFENWMHKDDKAPVTFAPINFLIDAGYELLYMGWVLGHPEVIVSAYANTNEIAVVPFLPMHRSRLGDLINIVAVPKERMEEFRHAAAG